MLTVQQFIEQNNINIDKLYVDEFWNSTANSNEPTKWIYLSDKRIDMIFDNDKRHDRNRSCYNLLTNNKNQLFTENIDYKLVDKNHELIQSNDRRNRKYYIVTTDCFKKLLLKANTKYSDKIYDYYMAVERLLWQYTQYQYQYQQKEQHKVTEQQIQLIEKQMLAVEEEKRAISAELSHKKIELEEKNKQLIKLDDVNQELVKYKQFISRDETIYVITTSDYSINGLWKICKNKKVSELVVAEFKTNNANQLEKRIEHILQHFRSTEHKNYYRVPYYLLVDIIQGLTDNLYQEEETINKIIREITETMSTSTVNWTQGMPKLLTAPEPEYFINSLKLTKDQATEIVKKALLQHNNTTIKIKQINESIKTMVKPKSNYKYCEWKSIIEEETNKKNITVKSR